jgi:hypothetical protein
LTSNTNVRLPYLQNPGTYPYIRFTQYRDGSWDRQDETPSNESHAKGHKLGAFEETDNSAGHKHFSVADRWSYGQGGSSETVEKNDHKVVGGSTVHQIQGDSHSENAGSLYHAIGVDHIHAVANSHVHYSGKKEDLHTESHVINTNDGDNHQNILGDHVVYIGGTKYQSISGEYGLYVPNGNIDMTVSGNGQIQSTNFTVNTSANVIINAVNGISINCGTSTIVITPNSITITAANINFIQA